jgi:hypothetical protein
MGLVEGVGHWDGVTLDAIVEGGLLEAAPVIRQLERLCRMVSRRTGVRLEAGPWRFLRRVVEDD